MQRRDRRNLPTIALRTIAALAAAVAALVPAPAAHAQNILDLSLDRMVDLAMRSSYQVRQLNLSIDRTTYNLEAQRARLRSRIDLELSAPDFRSVSENLWNSTEGRYDIVRENSRRLEAELSVRQPVILFGFPTNGYLSLNNQIYRYSQIGEDGDRDLRYYNRAFIEYTQPLFQPNNLRNDLEFAELELEGSQLGFVGDVVELVGDVSDDYFRLFDHAYSERIRLALVSNLEDAMTAAEQRANGDTSRAIDRDQVRVELANARERLQQVRSQFRLSVTSLRTRLNIPAGDSIVLTPSIEIAPVNIDPDAAVRHAFNLTPRMRQLAIQHRRNEMNLNATKDNGGLQLNLRMTYGREMRDPDFSSMWDHPTNSYTLGMNGQIPIWDWGERKARINAAEINVLQTDLRIEEAELDIQASVQSEIRNIAEFQSRALAMEDNLTLASNLSAQGLERYRRGEISILEVIQAFRRESDTAENLLDAYLGWRRSLRELQQLTFYDFESNRTVLDRFGVRLRGGEN